MLFVRCVLKDPQGSLTATICGNTVERLSYDAWGRRRNPNGFGYSNVTHTFDRGYTLHEHYDDFDLINMNGRMYDPVMSSFLSVDRYVQQPGNSQGFNRYAYCMHNPLRYTDPSGWRKQGREPSSGNYEHWSMRYAVPVYEPRDYQNPYYLYNQSFFGNYEGIMSEGGGSFGGGGAASYGFESSYGYYVTHLTNGLYNYCFASTQLQLIRNWQENPSFTTNKELLEAGITNLTVGIINGQIGGEDGYRNSYYQWIDDAGMTHSAAAYFEYVGGHENNWYVMSNAPLWSYATFCYGDYTVPSLLQKGFAATSSVAAIGVGAVKTTEGVKKLSQIPGKVGKIARCTNVLGYVGPAFNLVYNFKQMRNGQMTSNEFLIRSAVSIVEIGLANVPIPIIGQACMIASIALTAYDVSGGFDNTLYNQSWIGKK